MNGDPLPVQHGYPLRLVVPGWYAVASVKWLTEIELIGTPLEAFFQTERYFFEWQREGKTITEPVRLQQVRSVITSPTDEADVDAGQLTIRGVAWSGAAPIAGVEVSVGDGPWQPAQLIGERRRHSWQWWELLTQVDGQGTTTRACPCHRPRRSRTTGAALTGTVSATAATPSRRFPSTSADAAWLHSRSRAQQTSRSQQYCRWVR